MIFKQFTTFEIKKKFYSKENQRKTLRLKGNRIQEKEIQIAKTFVTIILAFFITNAPLIFILIMNELKGLGIFILIQNEYGFKSIHYSCLCISHINSAINMFIYAYKVKSIRQTLKRVICCKKE